MAERGSDLDLKKEQARQKRAEEAKQLQRKMNDELSFTSEQEDLFGGVRRVETRDATSMRAEKALGKYNYELMKLSNKICLYGVDQQPMTPLPDQKPENPLISGGRGGEGVRKDLFKEKKHLRYQEYLKQKQQQESNQSVEHPPEISQRSLSAKSHKEGSSNLPESNSEKSRSGDKVSSSHQRRSSKDRAGHSASLTQSSLSKSQNRTDQHNVFKPQVPKVPFSSPSPVKKNQSTVVHTHTPKKEEVVKTKSSHDETTTSVTSKILKDLPPPRNGMINGAAKHFKPKPPVNLPKLDIKEAQNLAESTDVESILKEMTRSVGAPLTAIHTPRKEEAKFPFPATPSKKNHLTESTQLKTKIGGQDGTTSQTRVNHETAESRQKSGKEKSSAETRSEAPDVPRPRAKPPGSTCGGGANAPTKEPRSLSSSESDDSSDNDSSGDSNEESSSSSEDESEKEDVPAELPKVISPLISPPAKQNESKNSSISSWSLDSLINQFNNTQSPITPIPSSSSSRNSDRKNDPRSPHKDENDEMLSKFITSEIIDKDNSPTEISHISPLPQTPPSSSACKWTSASLHSSESANSKSPRVSHSSQNAHKSRDKKNERTVDPVGAFGIKKRKSSYSSDSSNSHKSQVRTPQKDIKSSTPNSSKSNKHRNSTHKSPAKSTLTDSDDSDVDIESFTPGKDAIPTALLNKADVTKRLFNSDKSGNVVKTENVVKSENVVRSENVVKSDSTRKSDKNRNVTKPNNKSKERTKEKPRKQKSNLSNSKERTPVKCDVKTSSSASSNGSGSIEKDVRNIFSEIGSEKLNLLSPIPNLPEKSNILSRTTKSPPKVHDLQKCLTYKNGKPSIMVRLNLSLLPKPWNTSTSSALDSKSENCDNIVISPQIESVISPQIESVRLPQNPVIDHNSDNENTTEYGEGSSDSDSDMDLDSPDSTNLIETPNPLEQQVKRDYIPIDSRLTTTPESRNSPVFSAHSPRHRKSSKRKQDSDRTDDQKRPKPARNNTPIEKDSLQKEKESHKDSREWDWKHPRRSEVKARRDSSSSLSSQPGSASLKQTKTQGTEPDELLVKSEVKASELEEKVEELVVHDQNGARFPTNGYPSSNEMQNWYREGDRDGDDLLPSPRHPRLHKQRLEDRLESADTYLAEAKKLKHQADNLNDKPAKTLTYLEAVLSFIQWCYVMEKDAISDISKIHKMYLETYKLISHTFRSRSSHDFNHNHMTRKEKILAVLSLRIQSLLCLKLFKLKKVETMKLKKAIDEYNKPSSKPAHAPSPHQSSWNGRSTVTPSHSSPTPSPAGSIGSVDSQGSDLIPSKLPNGNAASCVSMSSPAPGVVSVPQRIHSLTQQYLSSTNVLVQCHDFWDQADVNMQEYQEFFEEVDEQCGALSLHSSILDLVFYVQSGLQKLKDV